MLVESIEEQSVLRRSPRSQAVDPVPPTKKSAKQAATAPNVAQNSSSIRTTGLAPAAEAPRIGKMATALTVDVAQRLTTAEE